MRQKWLNLILHLTSKIHNTKQKLVMCTLSRAIGVALQIIFLELLLLIISLPSYFFIKEDFTLFKGHGEKVIVNYRMRRKFIVSVVIIIGFLLLVAFTIYATVSVFFAPINAVSL